MYNQKVLEIFKNPLNFGGLQGSNAVAKVVDEKTKDVVKFYFKINEEQVIEEARYKTMGCVASIVCSIVVTQLVKEKTLDQAKNITKNDIFEVIGELDEDKLNYVDLVLNTLNATIEDYYKRKEKEEKTKNV